MQNFGEKLKQARKRKKLTQEALGRQLGITKFSVRDYERNKSKPKYDNLLAICKLLEVSADYLMGLDESHQRGATKGRNDDGVAFSDENAAGEYDPKKFSARLQSLMKAHKMTHQALADELGVSRSVVTQYISGARQPSIEVFVAIARYFGVSLDELAGDREQ